VKKSSTSLKDGYDCFDAALKVKEILRNHDIKSDVYIGKDEMCLWDTHYFVITDDGITVDGVPLYKTIGARHEPIIKPTKKSIEKLQSIIPLYGNVPLRYEKISETVQFLTKIGIKRVSDITTILERMNGEDVPPTKVIIDAFLIENGKPTEGYERIASFDETTIRKLHTPSVLPTDISMDESMIEFERLLNKKIVKLSEKAYNLNLQSPRNLKAEEVNIDRVNPILIEGTKKDMEVLVHLVENIPFARYL